jgi:hypothetical protein
MRGSSLFTQKRLLEKKKVWQDSSKRARAEEEPCKQALNQRTNSLAEREKRSREKNLKKINSQ